MDFFPFPVADGLPPYARHRQELAVQEAPGCSPNTFPAPQDHRPRQLDPGSSTPSLNQAWAEGCSDCLSTARPAHHQTSSRRGLGAQTQTLVRPQSSEPVKCPFACLWSALGGDLEGRDRLYSYMPLCL